MMNDIAVDPALLFAWLAARSVARGLPAPVADRGGFRVDTNADGEACRWLFPRVGPGLAELAGAIVAPGYLLKLCGPVSSLRAVLPPRWQVQPAAWFMVATGAWDCPLLVAGYVIEVERSTAVTRVRVVAPGGEIVAEGHAAETAEAFVYDRIVTAAGHRRRGLGRAVMTALRQARRDVSLPELLVATAEGRALYRSLGWRTLSDYATGFIPA